MLQGLREIHKGETAWIIGKGMSLLDIKLSDVGDGPVICLGESIIVLETLKFPNVLYSLQKDGGERRKYPFGLSAECDVRDCDHCSGVVRPQGSILLMHDLEARYCFEDYSPRYLFTLEEIGLPYNEISVVCAIRIAQLMGCIKFKFVSFDAHATGDEDCIIPIWTHERYKWLFNRQKEILPQFLKGLDYEWITPKE